MSYSYSIEEKKENGIFYTPTFLASFLARKVGYYWNKVNGSTKIVNILDPACGDSILLRNFIQESTNQDISNTNFIGIDKDINAIVSSINLFSTNINYKFFNTDGLFPVKGLNTFQSWKNFKEENDVKEGFDVILSNPPWGAEMSEYDNLTLQNNFITAKGQFDICTLFIENIVNNINDNGVFGLILPDSLFNQEQWIIRSLLLKETSILYIARLGEKIFEGVSRACVVIIGTKQNIANHQIDCFRLGVENRKLVLENIMKIDEVERKMLHHVPQKRFLTNKGFLFDIDLKETEKSIIEKIEKSTLKVQKFVENTRGAEISKKGFVCKCNKCNSWLPIPKSSTPKCTHCAESIILSEVEIENIVLNHNGEGNIKLKVGEDLFRYTSISKNWMNTKKKGINYKDLSLYQGDKILVRKTGVGMTACLDYDNAITNQVVYVLKLRTQFLGKMTLEFILAVLNSRAMTYYLLKKYGETEWKSHPYMTQKMLINLPFPKIDFANKQHISKIQTVTEIVKLEIQNSKEKNISLKNDLLIEKIIACFFDLDKNDYQQIFDNIAAAEQLIPIKRLLNCNSKDIFDTDGI